MALHLLGGSNITCSGRGSRRIIKEKNIKCPSVTTLRQARRTDKAVEGIHDKMQEEFRRIKRINNGIEEKSFIRREREN